MSQIRSVKVVNSVDKQALKAVHRKKKVNAVNKVADTDKQ